MRMNPVGWIKPCRDLWHVEVTAFGYSFALGWFGVLVLGWFLWRRRK